MKPTPLPSKAELWRLLDYDPAIGKLTWKERPEIYPGAAQFNQVFAGKAAFTTLKGGGYPSGRLLGRYVRANRVAFKMIHGTEPPEIDMENGDRADNRACNLAAATRQSNSRNRARSKINTSGVVGVCQWHDRKGKEWWTVKITVGGKQKHLGLFPKTEAGLRKAAIVRRKAEREYGYHRNHGRAGAIARSG